MRPKPSSRSRAVGFLVPAAVRTLSIFLATALLAGCATHQDHAAVKGKHPEDVASWRLGADSVSTGRAGAAYQTGAREHVATRRPAGAASEKGEE